MLLITFFTLGMLARFFTAVRPPFTEEDKVNLKVMGLIIILVPSTFLGGGLLTGSLDFKEITQALPFFSFVFLPIAALICAAIFQKRLTPVMTKGALLVYGLAGLFLSFSTSIFWQIVLGLCCAVVLFLCLTKKTVPVWGRALLVYGFLALQIFLIWMFSWQHLSDGISSMYSLMEEQYVAPLLTPLEALFLGYIFFTAVCNVIVFFMLPEEHDGILPNIREHLSFLRTRYNEKDIGLPLTIGIIGMFFALWLNESVQILSTISAISLFLIVGTLLTTDFKVKVLNVKEVQPHKPENILITQHPSFTEITERAPYLESNRLTPEEQSILLKMFSNTESIDLDETKYHSEAFKRELKKVRRYLEDHKK